MMQIITQRSQVQSRFGCLANGTLSTQQKKSTCFKSGNDRAVKGDRGLPLSYAVPKIQWPLTSTAATTTKVWNTLTFDL